MCSRGYSLNCICKLSPPCSEVCSLCETFFLQVHHTLGNFCNLITGDKHYPCINLGGMEGKYEYSDRHWRNYTDLKSNMESLLPCAGELIDTTWLRVSFGHLSAHLPPVFNKAGNQFFPGRAQAWLCALCSWIWRGITL